MMLASQSLSYPKFLAISSSKLCLPRNSPIEPRLSLPKHPPNFRLYAQNGGKGSAKSPTGDNGPMTRGGGGSDGDGEDRKKDPFPAFNFRWSDLLNPEPDNVVAIGLTGLLTWASVQVLSQLLFISLAIFAAALKYSFIAALLIFILITLL